MYYINDYLQTIGYKRTNKDCRLVSEALLLHFLSFEIEGVFVYENNTRLKRKPKFDL